MSRFEGNGSDACRSRKEKRVCGDGPTKGENDGESDDRRIEKGDDVRRREGAKDLSILVSILNCPGHGLCFCIVLMRLVGSEVMPDLEATRHEIHQAESQSSRTFAPPDLFGMFDRSAADQTGQREERADA